MRSITVSELCRSVLTASAGRVLGETVTDPKMMIMIAAGVVLVIMLLLMAVMRKRSRDDTVDEPSPAVPSHDDPGTETVVESEYAPGDIPAEPEDGLTIGGSLPVDHHFRSISAMESPKDPGPGTPGGKAADGAGALKKGRFGHEYRPEESADRSSVPEEIVELYRFRHRTGVKICPYCDSENMTDSGRCVCCGGPLTS